MTNKQWLATLTTEECYDVLHWLFTVHAHSVNNSKKGNIQWLDSTDSQWRRFYKGEYEKAERKDVPDTNVGKWIPVSERLPEYAHFYLTSTEYDSVYCDFYDGYRFNRTEKVIAWMPLPEPYTEEEQ